MFVATPVAFGDDPVFELHREAAARHAKGRHCINATLGVLMDDAGSLTVLPTVAEVMRSIGPDDWAPYAGASGTEEFLEGVLDAVPRRHAAIARECHRRGHAGGNGRDSTRANHLSRPRSGLAYVVASLGCVLGHRAGQPASNGDIRAVRPAAAALQRRRLRTPARAHDRRAAACAGPDQRPLPQSDRLHDDGGGLGRGRGHPRALRRAGPDRRGPRRGLCRVLAGRDAPRPARARAADRPAPAHDRLERVEVVHLLRASHRRADRGVPGRRRAQAHPELARGALLRYRATATAAAWRRSRGCSTTRRCAMRRSAIVSSRSTFSLGAATAFWRQPRSASCACRSTGAASSRPSSSTMPRAWPRSYEPRASTWCR